MRAALFPSGSTVTVMALRFPVRRGEIHLCHADVGQLSGGMNGDAPVNPH